MRKAEFLPVWTPPRSSRALSLLFPGKRQLQRGTSKAAPLPAPWRNQLQEGAGEEGG